MRVTVGNSGLCCCVPCYLCYVCWAQWIFCLFLHHFRWCHQRLGSHSLVVSGDNLLCSWFTCVCAASTPWDKAPRNITVPFLPEFSSFHHDHVPTLIIWPDSETVTMHKMPSSCQPAESEQWVLGHLLFVQTSSRASPWITAAVTSSPAPGTPLVWCGRYSNR